MRSVKISACQFELKKLRNFEDFVQQIQEQLIQVPSDSDYVIFPELFTTGLLTTLPQFENFSVKEMTLLNQFTDQFKEFFIKTAKERNQVIIAGSHLEYKNNNLFNITYLFDKNGTYVEHKKTHIFPAEAQWGTNEGDEINVFDIGPAKVGIANCYEMQIPEVSRILAVQGAEIIFSPSYTFSEYGFWRVRHCAHSRCIENQVYVVHCSTIGTPGGIIPKGIGKASILSPCDEPWSKKGIVVEGEMNKSMTITGTVNIDELANNRESGATTTFNDRKRREELYRKYEPYRYE
ncbi:nitrilase-related carbon-nitrogen hydrolase [Alkalihalobacterium elongatum]|uniref:nitrilase-related carbon-nitrogen hydrolase n=1 Tax=Alkalihalobacterium elongatum TaxID=2675466 RepID=UPI001C1FB74B|nr:nitrilase-related carbon-nitrogen hydrolase [Alkalihalobacterium elongatum]